MHYISHYPSPLGKLLLASDGTHLTGLWFAEQKYFAAGLDSDCREQTLPIFEQAASWLDVYFSGREPDISVALHWEGTAFQKEVWEILRTIEYGKTMTYGQIAQILAQRRGVSRMSAQAVGSAVGHNPVSILIPCHRVMGTNGSLTGYAGGVERKAALLRLEGIQI